MKNPIILKLKNPKIASVAISIDFALKFNIGIGSNFGISTSLIHRYAPLVLQPPPPPPKKKEKNRFRAGHPLSFSIRNWENDF